VGYEGKNFVIARKFDADRHVASNFTQTTRPASLRRNPIQGGCQSPSSAAAALQYSSCVPRGFAEWMLVISIGYEKGMKFHSPGGSHEF
jgi:hypothetical protein